SAVERQCAAPLEDECTGVEWPVWCGASRFLRLESGAEGPGCGGIGATGIFGRARDLVDETPVDMVFAQLAGAAEPSAALHRFNELSPAFIDGGRKKTSGHGKDTSALLGLGLHVIVPAIDADERRDVPKRPLG